MDSSSNFYSPIVRVGPFEYIHVVDTCTNITSLFVGPLTFVSKENEKVVSGPTNMITISNMQYCIIKNPVKRDAFGSAILNSSGQVQLEYGEIEYRFARTPFPLYPGEQLEGDIQFLSIIPVNSALLLTAKIKFTDSIGITRYPGEKWSFIGLGTYYPRKEVDVIGHFYAKTINIGEAIVIVADKDTLDHKGIARVAGEQWLVSEPGAYLPGPYETILELIEGIPLNDKTAVHVRAEREHFDERNIMRKPGEEWLITQEDASCYIRGVHVTIVKMVDITNLDSRQYCVILNPIDADGKPQFGKKVLVVGEKSFFLKPGESLENGVENIYILSENQGLVLTARASFLDNTAQNKEISSNNESILRNPGERWLVRGPLEYVPPVEVEVVCMCSAIPLDENEGIYVRNISTGQVRAVIGQSYMLSHDEELWEKPLPIAVKKLLIEGKDPLADRNTYQAARNLGESVEDLDTTRVISFRVPHNAAVQIYDYSNKLARVIFGPDRVMLEPNEHFTLLVLSGGKPKRPGMISSLCLLLGPDFCTDVVTVETADHARLSLQLSYNWIFLADKNSSQAEATKIFSVPDFIGDMCKAIASRIRGSVAAVSFDDFHKNSARIIRSSVFGLDSKNKIKDRFVFPQNNLAITSVDVQSVEPVDQRTRDSLQKSVQLAIEITTNSQEASARHEANCREQEAKGRLERQRIKDEAAAEEARQHLLELQVLSTTLESTGQAKAEAMSKVEASRIEGNAAIEQARLKSKALEFETKAELTRLEKARELELEYIKKKNELELKKLADETEISVEKFVNMVEAFGPETLRSIVKAGPEHEIRLLRSLGLQSTLITDGNSPLNLFTTARGLIGKAMGDTKAPCHC